MSIGETHPMFGAVAGAPEREVWPPEGASPLVSFRVDGHPRPAGSKDAGIVTRFDPQKGRRVPVLNPATGMPRTFTKDTTGAGGKNWRSDVRQAVADALGAAHELADGPLAVRVTFFIASPASRYGTGRNAGVLKPTAARYPHRSKLADGDKLCRALHDALSGLAWTDDSRVVHCWWTRDYGRGGAQVDIYTLPEFVQHAPGPRLAAPSLLESEGSTRYHSGYGDENEAVAV